MAQLPADTLRNRSFLGLLIAQFLAAFNDQAIHAAAMFFAINEKIMTDAKAISLMPILFYAPWALFVTLAGYYADRFSKRNVLVFWKIVEIGIMLVATYGFWLGAVQHRALGPWIVLVCVFLMGMHSAFFVPAKYGAMPDILQPQLLSRGNGWLESLSFLAVILGTVCGGLLTHTFHRQHEEHYIGFILLGLAVIGAAASLFIQPMRAANPDRPFPAYVFGPLVGSLRTLWRSPPLRFAMIGIAFFTFMVAYMRATVYMLGEAQNPRWTESKTSIIVGTTSLGIALGAPLAGFVSGRKIELGLVPIGSIGMAAAATLAGLFVNQVVGLVACIILIGFFTGFYLVPLFSLQQHRAPKQSKGDVIATNNFVNVIGAMLASAVFIVIIFGFKQLGMAQPIAVQDEYARGALVSIESKNGQTVGFVVEGEKPLTVQPKSRNRDYVIELTTSIPATIDEEEPPQVIVAHYQLQGLEHYLLRLANESPPLVHDTTRLPRLLFYGAGVMAMLTLVLLCRQVPDLLARMNWVLQNVGHLVRMNHIHVVGTAHVPYVGPVVLATNCHDRSSWGQVVSATDRAVRMIDTPCKDSEIDAIVREAEAGTIIALAAPALDCLPELQNRLAASYLPVYYGPAPGGRVLRVAFGSPLPLRTSRQEVEAAIAAVGQMPDAELDVH